MAPSDESISSRDKILDTAEPLFARQGFAGVGLRELSDRVGMSKSSLFHHFPSKVQLYVAVIERVFSEFDRTLAERADESGDPVDRLHGWVQVVIDKLAQHPTWAALLLRSLFEGDVIAGEDDGRIDALFACIVSRVSRAMEEGIAAGALRDVSIPHTIQTLIGMTVFHFASGEMGEDLLGEPIYSSRQIASRLEHVHAYIDHALRLP